MILHDSSRIISVLFNTVQTGKSIIIIIDDWDAFITNPEGWEDKSRIVSEILVEYKGL